MRGFCFARGCSAEASVSGAAVRLFLPCEASVSLPGAALRLLSRAPPDPQVDLLVGMPSPPGALSGVDFRKRHLSSARPITLAPHADAARDMNGALLL